jgi:hypothetical protein
MDGEPGGLATSQSGSPGSRSARTCCQARRDGDHEPDQRARLELTVDAGSAAASEVSWATGPRLARTRMVERDDRLLPVRQTCARCGREES